VGLTADGDVAAWWLVGSCRAKLAVV
jgi:hypothetical protein